MVPKLRFSLFHSQWNAISLGNIIKIKSGQGFKAEEYAKPQNISKVRLLQIENVGHGTAKWTDNVKYLPSDYLSSYKELVLDKGDIVLALNRPITNNQLKIATLKAEDVPSILYQRVGKLIFLESGVCEQFYYQMFQEKIKEFVLLNSIGSDQPFISLTTLYRYEVYSTTPHEQTKIADFLSSVDKKIALLNKQYDLLSQYKKCMMQMIFSQELRFKDESGEAFPDWETKLISDIVIVNPKSKILPTKFIYIDLESVEKGLLLKENLISKNDAPIRAQRLLQLNDVLFQLVRPYQNNNYLFLLNGDYVASTGYAQLRAKYCSKFLYQLIHLEGFISEVMNRCTGTSYPAINSSDLASIEVEVPCELEQTKIANFLSAIDDKITTKKTELDKLKIWKQGLLQQMFV